MVMVVVVVVVVLVVVVVVVVAAAVAELVVNCRHNLMCRNIKVSCIISKQQ